MRPNELSDRTFIVTGGTQGIGLAIVTTIVQAGGNVVVTGRDSGRGAAVVAPLGGRALFVSHDAVDEESWGPVIEAAGARFGDLHGLVNNVGGVGTLAPVADIGPDQFSAICDLNVRPTLIGMQRGFAAMRAHATGGSIVNIVSIAALYMQPFSVGYCAGKRMLPALSRGAARAFSPHVRVNCIYPGVIASEATERNFARKGKGNREAFLATVPMGRLGEYDEIARVVGFLLSDRSRSVTGSDFVIDGGKTIL